MKRGVPIVLIILGILIVGCIEEDDSPIDSDNDLVPDHDDPDDDNDGMIDEWEMKYGLDPKDPNDKHEDLDSDGIDNKNEYDSQTDPTDPMNFSIQMKEWIATYGGLIYTNTSALYPFSEYDDSDFDDDGMPNQWEFDHFLCIDFNDSLEDLDDDGYSNKAEFDRHTDPHIGSHGPGGPIKFSFPPKEAKWKSEETDTENGRNRKILR